MDYKKIVIYIVIILIGVGVWYKNELDERRRREEIERFAQVYASTMVMAELYRNDPEKYFEARDSIMAEYNVDTLWVSRVQGSFEGREEKWAPIFTRIQNIADSLIEHFKANPVERDTTAAADSE